MTVSSSTRGLILLTLLAFVTIGLSSAQQTAPSEWTWVGGSTAVLPPGVLGTKGTPAPANFPPGADSASSWTDTSGNLWVFGGGYLVNELWRYSPSTNEWTWMTGSTGGPEQSGSDSGGVYGTLGVPSPQNTPGERSRAVTWTDKSGNFWLFGGYGDIVLEAGGKLFTQSGYLNDLWEFNPATNQWTWMSGSNFLYCTSPLNSGCGFSGVYGTLETPAAANVPGGRSGAASWIDTAGNLWLFGGLGFDGTAPTTSGPNGDLNDLWRFNPSTKIWTWMGGPSTANHFLSVASGAQGVFEAGNWPGDFNGPVSWTDKSGHFWLFGQNSGNAAAELWEYDTSVNEWAWMGLTTPGTCSPLCNGANGVGVYGNLGTFAPGNFPGPRAFANGWTDNKGNLWLFGGDGADSNRVLAILNDLWQFNPGTKQWAWMSGSSTAPASGEGMAGVYGAMGSPAAGNSPGGRQAFATWTDLQGNLWLFGGMGFGLQNQPAYSMFNDLNDLWVYRPSAGPLPTTATPVFSAVSGTYDTIQTISITDSTNGSIIYYTTDGTTPTALSTVYAGPITVSTTQTLKTFATASGCYDSETAVATYTISNPVNPPPVIAGLSPAFAAPAGPAFTLFVNGSGFTNNTIVYWGATALTTTAVSATLVAAQVPATELLTSGIVAIQVQNPAPGGGTSGTLQFEVDTARSGSNPAPVINPTSASATAGTAASYRVTLPSSATSATASCLNLPSGALCSYSFTTGTLSISTAGATPKGTYTVTAVFTETLPGAAVALIPLPILLLPILFWRRRWFGHGVMPAACCFALALLLGAALSGCGGGGAGSSSLPPPATHQVTSSAIVNLTVN